MRTKPAHLVSAGVACVAVVLTLFAPSAARADDTSLGATGGTVSAVRARDIRLAAETVQAVCFESFAEYRVDFRFVNDGRPRTVRLGFPFSDTIPTEETSQRPVGFQAWQGARPLTVRAVGARFDAGKLRNGYYVHSALFPHGATTITVSYLAQESGTARGRGRGLAPNDPRSGMASWYEYWLHTGATWKGPIGGAVVRYRLADSFRGRGIQLTAAEVDKGVPATTPAWTRPLPRSYQWLFTDFEPAPARGSEWWRPQSSSDIVLGFSSDYRGSSSLPARWSVSSSPSSEWTDYGRDCLQDGQLGTCWAEGVVGPGIGEWAEARFRRPQHLRELRLVSGNNAYFSAFSRYARPKTLRAEFSDGSSALLHLRDAPVLQRFPVNVTTRTVRLVIESVYAGTDYPATCISEVEFGRTRAPGYAAFSQLLRDPAAMGRLPSWAGPAAAAPRTTSRAAAGEEARDAESVAGGDLIGVDQYSAFPADKAPFREPASLAEITRRNSAVTLPVGARVGRPTAVTALSTWTYEIRYSSGIDLLVNTRVTSATATPILAELTQEASSMDPYVDGRKLPFEVTTIGDKVVGVSRAGTVLSCCCEAPGNESRVPAQVFWRDGDRSYHLYAGAAGVSVGDLAAVARVIIDPAAGIAVAPEPAPARRPSWLAVGLVSGAALVILVFLLRRRRAPSGADARTTDVHE